MRFQTEQFYLHPLVGFLQPYFSSGGSTVTVAEARCIIGAINSPDHARPDCFSTHTTQMEKERGGRTTVFYSRAKKGNKESGENKGLWKEAGNEERHLNPYPLELVSADFLPYICSCLRTEDSK